MTTPNQLLLQAVADVARLVGATAMSYYDTGVSTEVKADGSPVTKADREAEQTAREWITARFPEDGILGEEFGEVRPHAARQWIVDPIDGTKSFIRGVPLWGSLVAVSDSDTVLAGAAYFPALNELIVAAVGEGAWWNNQHCHVSEVASLTDATATTTDERFLEHPQRREQWQSLAARVAVSRSWGDCYGYLMVATGRAEVMADPLLSAWDAAPFQPIISEAGGVFTDWNGLSTVRASSAIATNGRLAATVRALLN